MKYWAAGMSLFLAVMTAALVCAGSASADVDSAKVTWRYPIAPGVWYPGDGPLPEKPVRYYRARCWPGCHRGSPYGKYPDKRLGMEPIFPTSTVPGSASTRGLRAQ